jgi:predicted permease
MLIWLLLVLIVATVLAALTLYYLTARLLTVDAMARGIAHPKLTGVLAAGTQNGIGILAYLALRRSHPIDVAADDPQSRARLKIASLSAFAVLLVSGVCALLVLMSGQL